MIASSKERFKNWLKKEGFKDWGISGNPSTISHYIYWVDRIKNQEGIEDWSDMPNHIIRLLREYGEYGNKKCIGAEGHSTVINALRRYSEFLLNDCDWQPQTTSYFI